MQSDFFHGLMRWNLERFGTTVQLPYLYYDNLSMVAVHTASTAKVRSLLPRPDLHPLESFPGRCLVAFSAFEYRKTDGDPYNEVAISFLVSHLKKPVPLIDMLRVMNSPTVSSYVWQLPVTGEKECRGGIDLFGLPKFLADIRFEKEPARITCSLSVAGTEILRLVGKVLSTRPGGRLRYLSYAVDGDCLVTVNTLVNHLEEASSRSGRAAKLLIGRVHPVSQALNQLQVSRAPIFYRYSPRNEAILFPARNILEEG